MNHTVLRRIVFLSVVFAGLSGGVWGQELINQTLRTGSLPPGWTQTDVTFTTAAGGYANFTDSDAILTTPTFDASENVSIDIEFDVAKFGSGGDGPITIEYSLNGGTTWLNGGDSDTPSGPSYLNSTISIASVSATMAIRFIRSDSPSQKRLRDVVITGIGTGTPIGGYCAVTGDTSFGTGITLVNIGTINSSTGVGTGYDDFTAISTDLDQGGTATLTVNLNTAGNYTVHAKVWIDWDQDENFNTTTEEYDLGDVTNESNGATNLSPLTIIIPAGATLGSTRMRVVCRYDIDPAGPCAGSDDGEIEDYTINVQPATVLPEPSNHVTNFNCAASSPSEMNLAWNDAAGPDLPSGYLIRWSDVGYGSIPDPADGTPVADGAEALNVPFGAETVTVSGLSPNTTYYFKIFPYSNSGVDIAYKTDGSVPQTDCETEEGPCANESFTDIGGGTTSSYLTRSWTGDNGLQWTATNARIDEPLNGDAITLNDNESDTYVESGNYDGGIADLTMTTQRKFAGGAFGNLNILVNGENVGVIPYFSGVTTTTLSGINVGGNVTIRIVNDIGGSNGGGDDRVAIDDVSWTCYDGCTPTHSITSFTPASGPAGTVVTIVGLGFTGTGAVSIGGQPAASFTVVDDNTITAELAENTGTGKIIVTKDDCPRVSAAEFEVLDNNGNCGGSSGGGGFASDLFISEVYDAASGSLAYIEIFNGTSANIDLGADNYVIRYNTGTVTDFSLSGTIASGDVFILSTGSSGSSCSGFAADLVDSDAPGFNGNDQIVLRKNGADLDYAPNPNHPDAGGTGSPDPGFSQVRNSSVAAPTMTYNAAEWNISDTENCDNLGIAPYSPGGNSIDITAQPEDVSCETLSFSVTATSTSGFPGTGAYTWRYHAPGENGWNTVSSLNGTNGITVTGANTPDITITGPVAAFLDYQFYVDIGASGSPQCRRYSNAARFTYDTRAFYRTKGSGEWTSPAVWEMSDAESGPYVDVCTYPVATNSDLITVQSGHSISVNEFRFSVDRLIIEDGGDLTVAGSVTGLTVLNGNAAGADFEINGTFTDGMFMGGSNGMDFADGATWQMSGTGTLVKTNTSSTVVYRENYEGGIGNIAPSADWIYRRLSTDVNIGTVAANMTYPNLIFENQTGSAWDMNTGPQALTGGSPMVVLGDMIIGETGSGITVYNNMTNAAPISVGGRLVIGSTSTLTNQAFESAAQEGTGFEVLGDLEIDGTLDLSATGTAPQRGQLIFAGGADQIGVGSGNVIFVNRLEMNKTAGNALVDFRISVNQTAVFNSGILEFDVVGASDAFLELGLTATATNASNASFVDGRVRKTADANFTFPIGDMDADGNAFYQPARIFDMAGTTTIDAQYFAEAHPNAGPYYNGSSNDPLDFRNIGNCDYWTVEKFSGSDPKVALTFTNPDPAYCNEVVEEVQLRFSRWNNFDWDEIPSAVITAEVASDQAIGTGVDSDYGDFVFSSNSNLNILPITLLSFTAEAVNNQVVETRWVTASEINNDFFTVERSSDAVTWEIAGTVVGAGNSTAELQYSFADDAPHRGISYYRLRQTDYDGTTVVTDPEAVFIGAAENHFALHKTYRSERGIELLYTATAPYLTVEVFDVSGRLVHGEVVQNAGARLLVNADFARGVYIVRISDNAQSDAMRFFY